MVLARRHLIWEIHNYYQEEELAKDNQKKRRSKAFKTSTRRTEAQLEAVAKTTISMIRVLHIRRHHQTKPNPRTWPLKPFHKLPIIMIWALMSTRHWTVISGPFDPAEGVGNLISYMCRSSECPREVMRPCSSKMWRLGLTHCRALQLRRRLVVLIQENKQMAISFMSHEDNWRASGMSVATWKWPYRRTQRAKDLGMMDPKRNSTMPLRARVK